MIVRAAEMWGPAETSFLLHARGIEHHSKGVENCMAAINLVVATGRIGREGCGYAMITGQGNGQGAREQGQKCDQLPGARDIENPEHRKYIAGVWGVPEESIPHNGLSAVPLLEAIHDGRIKGLLLICFNPMVSLPDGDFIREALEKLEFFAGDRLLHVGDGALRRRGAARLADGRRRRHHDQRRGARDPSPPGRRPAARRARGLADHLRSRGAARRRRQVRLSTRPARSSTSCASPPRAASPTTPASPGSASTARWASSGRVPSLDHPGTPRLYEGGKFGHPDGKAHFQPVDWRPAAEEPDAEYPIILTTGRVVSQYLSGTQTRRIGALVDQYPQPLCEMHPRLAAQLGIADGDFVRVESRRGAIVVRAQVVKTIRPDTVFVPYHWPLDRAANNCTIRAIDPVSKIPEFKICAVRVSKAEPPDDADRCARAGRPEASDERAGVLHRLLALHRLPGLRAGVRGMRHAPRRAR